MKCVLKISCLLLRFKSYHQIIKSKLLIKSNSNQIKPFVCFVLFCFVWWLWLQLSTMIVQMIVKMCFLVQEPEENVNILNNYIQIMQKSTYLKTYLKKEIWSKKKMEAFRARRLLISNWSVIQNKINSSHFHFLFHAYVK